NTAIINSGTVSFAGSDTLGNGATTSSPVITIGTGATLASNGFFNTIWNLNLGGGTLLANGGVNASFPTYQLAGTLLVNGSTASTMSTGAGSNNMINVGGQGNATLTLNVADVTSSTAADLTVGVILQNSTVSGGAQAGALTKSGAGTLVLSAANTYTGATTVSGGVLQIASGGALTSAGNVNSISGGQLSIAGSVTMAANTYFAVGSGVASTSGTTTIDGGTLAVGNNAFLIGGGRGDAQLTRGTGVFTLNSGTVTVAAGGGTGGGSDTSAVWLNPYGNVGPSSLNLNGGVFSTARSIRDGSSSSPTMAFNGGTLRAAASIDLLPASALVITIQSGGAVIDSGAFSPTISNALVAGTPSGGLTKLGSGTLTLSAANTYTGTTTVSGGSLRYGIANALSTGPVTVENGATLDLASFSDSVGTVTLTSGTIIGTGTLTSTAGFVVTSGSIAAPLAGSATLTKQGAGTVVLSGASPFTGATSVNGGLLQIASGGSLSSAGNINSTAGGNLSIAGSVTMAANTYFAVGNGILNTTGTTSIDGGTLAVGNNAFLIGGSRQGLGTTGGLGTFVVNSGTVTVGAGGGTAGGQDASAVWLNPYSSGTSQLILNGGVFSTARVIQNGSVAGVTMLAFNGGALRLGANLANITTSISTVSIHSGGAVIDTNGFNGTFSQGLASGTGVTAGGLTKLGSGTLTLSAANTYTGATTISVGRLALGAAGSFANSASIIVGNAGSSGAVLDLTAKTGAFAIGAGQTLSGGGTVQLASSGTLNVQGTFSPGNSPGLFTYQAGTTVLSGTTVMEILGTSRATSPSHGSGFYDAVNVAGGGTLQLGGLLTLDFSQAFADDTTFDLFSTVGGSSLAGNFTGVNVIGSFYTGLTWNQASGVWKSTNTVGGQSLEFSSATGQLVVVPEPGALVLAGLGIAAAVWAVRRRK
ncbi:MAG: beta strand repeat-containing protein, partial [Planctomycetia bacterium]